MQIGILGLFGAVFSGFMLDKADIDFAWYTWVFVAIGVIGVLGWLRVDLNAKVLAIFLTTEILVVVLFDLVVARRPGAGRPHQRGVRPVDRLRRRPRQPRSASRWPPSSASSRLRSTARSARTRAARSPERPTSPSGITALFYAFSAWMLQSAVGAEVVTNPDALVEGGFVGATGGPDPTTILFITLDVQTSTTIADIATLLFCTSLFAASLSFHNARRALLLRARQGAGAPERVRQAHARERRAVHRLAGPDDHRGGRGRRSSPCPTTTRCSSSSPG